MKREYKYVGKTIKRPSLETMKNLGSWDIVEPECKIPHKKKADENRAIQRGKLICKASAKENK